MKRSRALPSSGGLLRTGLCPLGTADSPSPPPPEYPGRVPPRTSSESLPSRFGRYRIFSKLASGGMATVYLARTEHRSGFEKVVALKVIHDHLVGENAFVEMFLDEARLAAGIDHPNVCTVFDFGQEQGVYYLAMEYLLGEPIKRIARIIARRKDKEEIKRLPWYVARIIADASEGLHAAHELRGADGEPLGVVHRDVSPENIVVTYDGGVKIVDFGVAKAAERIHETKISKIKGKFAYVAPEQVRNEEVDRRADVWGLGVCLWEALTLRRLFRRDSDAATLSAVVFDDVPAPSEVSPWVPADLDKIVLRALARDREQRYRTARALGQELRKFLTISGMTIGTAEISEWMERLFPHERESRLLILQQARQGKPSDSFPAVTDEGSYSGETLPSVSALVSPEEAAALRRGVSLADLGAELARFERRASDAVAGLIALDVCDVLQDRPVAVSAEQIRLSEDGLVLLSPPLDACRASEAARSLVRAVRALPTASGPISELLRSAEFRSPLELHAALAEALRPMARGQARKELIELLSPAGGSTSPDGAASSTTGVDPLVKYAEDTTGIQTLGTDRGVLDLPPDDDLARDIKGGGAGRALLVVLLLLGAGAAALALSRPTLVRSWLGLDEPDTAAAPEPTEPIEQEPIAGELVLHVSPQDARVLVFEGRAPVDVGDIPVGVSQPLVAMLEGYAATWAQVPADARWVDGRFDLAVPLLEEEASAPELPLPTAAPSDAPRGTAHVVTTPPGAKIFRLVGVGPDVRVRGLDTARAQEILVLREGYEPHREIVSTGSWEDPARPRVERRIELRERSRRPARRQRRPRRP